jgi:hypothetical protein
MTEEIQQLLTLALAGELATNGLPGMIARGLENLLTITATPVIHQAAPGQNRSC